MSNLDIYRAATALARRQHGVASWQQLIELASPAQVKRWAQQHRLERVAPSVYRFPGGSETWLQQVTVATLDVSGWASHRTGAALHGLEGHPRGVIEVTVHRHRRSSRLHPFTIHESKDLRGIDMTLVHGIPCTTVVRTIVDLPAVTSIFRTEQALDCALREKKATIEQVVRRSQEVARRGRNGTRKLRVVLADRPGGYVAAGSTFELLMTRILRDTGLPMPKRQVLVVDGDFVAYIDFGWPDLLLGIECDSYAFHSGKTAHEWDRARRRHLQLLGWDLAEFTYDDVTLRAAEVVSEIKAFYALRLAQLSA